MRMSPGLRANCKLLSVFVGYEAAVAEQAKSKSHARLLACQFDFTAIFGSFTCPCKWYVALFYSTGLYVQQYTSRPNELVGITI